MHTRCPNCGTLYRIDEAELKKAQGQVRCYRCSEVFDAFDARSGTDAHLPTTETSDESLPRDELAQEFRSILNHPEEDTQPVDETSISSLAFDDLESEAPERPEAHDDSRLPAEPTSDEDSLAADAILGAGKTPPPRPRRLLNGLLALLLTGTAVGQLLWLQRDQLLQTPRYHQLAAQACQWLGCDLPPLRAPEQFSIIERKLTPASDSQPTLLLKLRARNGADFAQPLPDLQVYLLDDNGKTIAQRRLHPADYLFPAQTDDLLIPPKEVITIELAFENPGLEASGFRLEWL